MMNLTIRSSFYPLLLLKRTLQTAAQPRNETFSQRDSSTSSPAGRMSAWLIYYYGDNSQFTLSDSVQIPAILSPTDVLIKIAASSVNQIDIRRREGYGNKLLRTYQTTKNMLRLGGNQPDPLEFPLILGRDFCGEIIRKGPNVTRFNVGDKVYGALGVAQQGTFAQYCVAGQHEICMKPNIITDAEAATLPLVSLTSWYAIRKFAGMNEQNSLGKRALMIGASGGVGQIGLQLFVNLGIETTALCTADTFDFVRKLGATDAVDYKQKNWFEELSQKPKYDIIFDTVGPRQYSFDRMGSLLNQGGVFVTIVAPLFRNVDKHGLLSGLSHTVLTATTETFYGWSKGIHCRWAAYVPDGEVLNEVKQLVEQGRLKTHVDPRIFSFDQIPNAIAHLENKQAKGKVAIKYTSP